MANEVKKIGSAIDDAAHDVVDFVGDVGTTVGRSIEDAASWVGDRLTDVVESIEKNPMILLAAVGGYFAIQGIMASMAAAGSISTSAILAEAGVDAIMLEMPTAAAATATGVGTLEATGVATASAASADIAASTALQAGATTAEATSIASSVSQGSGLMDAVTQYASSIVDKINPFTAAADVTSTSSASQSVFSQIGELSNKLYTSIGETILPDASAGVQKLAGQGVFNTTLNGGDLEAGVKSTLMTFGLENLGSIPDLAGKSIDDATSYFKNLFPESFKTLGTTTTDFASKFDTGALTTPTNALTETSNLTQGLGSPPSTGGLDTLEAINKTGQSSAITAPIETPTIKTGLGVPPTSSDLYSKITTAPIGQPTGMVTPAGQGYTGPVESGYMKAAPPGFFNPETKANIEGLTAGAKLATAGYGVARMTGLIGPDEPAKKAKTSYDYSGLGSTYTGGTTMPTKATYSNAPIQGFHMVKVKNQSGNSLYVPFIGEKPLNPIPSGYTPI